MNDMRKLINLMEGVTAVPGLSRKEIVREGPENDITFILSSIRDNYGVARDEQELMAMVAGETGYTNHPDFQSLFTSALDTFLNRNNEDEADDESTSRICTACNGSGEGQYDGTRCLACHGSGVESRGDNSDDEDPPEYERDPLEYERDPLDLDEAYDLQNGYNDTHSADGEDYFPNGADGPVVKSVGPSGAKQGDNPEQKSMQVSETHKELVYAYRSFLKESASKKK